MAVSRSGRGGGVRSSTKVGPNYDEGRYDVPWNQNIDAPFGESRDEKSILSEAGMLYENDGEPITKGKYDALWNGK